MPLTLNSILNKYTLSLMMAISFSFSPIPTIGMDVAEDETPSAIQPTPQRVLMPKEALEDSARLFNLCTAGKYEEALKKAFPEPVLEIETQLIEGRKVVTGFTIGDMEQYNFFRLCSLSMIYTHLGNNEQLNPAKAIQYYQRSYQYIDTYLSSPVFGPSFISQYASVNNVANKHRALAYKKSSEASSQWAHLLIKPIMCDADKVLPKKLLLSSIDSLKKAINYLEISPEINTLDNVLKFKFDLFNEYITFINFSDLSEGGGCLKEAKKIHRDFQNNNHIYYKAKTFETLKFLELKQERNRSLIKTGSKKVQEIRQENDNKQTVILNTMLRGITADANNQKDLQVKVLEEHNSWFFLAQNDLQNPAIISSLKKIESKIYEKLIDSNTLSSLFDVYQKYETFLGGNILREHIMSHILPAFLFSGDIEGALERVIILAQLEHNKQGNNSLLTLCLRAAIKNLNGDNKEWEEFEQKIISMRQQEQEKKKLAKEKKEQQRVATIRKNQAGLPSLDKKNDERKKEQKPQKCVTDATEKKRDLPLDQEGPFGHLLSTSSPQEEKTDKKKRHEEAAIQRNVQRNQLTSLAIEEPKVQTSPPSIVVDSNFLIRDLYLLTGVAKDVDIEIENNTWDFTRENLMMYFEALECIATDGGKHKKVSLPKAVIISYEGSTITILNDLGGALTLPRWDGSEGNGQVPPYLRKQILKAREKLVLLRVKVKNIINSTLD
ncbi:MAG: hypothetical protein ACOH2E_01585 [Candidatus Paracaedibacter sp.]